MPHSDTAVAATHLPRRAATLLTARQTMPQADEAIQVARGEQRLMSLREIFGALARMVLGVIVLAWIGCILYLPQTNTGSEEQSLAWFGFFILPIAAVIWAMVAGAITMPDRLPRKRRL